MDRIISHDGTELFVKDWGAGKPVVFVHGWLLSADMWDHQMLFLADRSFRCIAYDKRGFGRSSQRWGKYDYDALADDLAILLQSLDLVDAILVGFGVGTGEIVRFLARHGSGRVAKIVLIGSILPCLRRQSDNPDGLAEAVFDEIRSNVTASRQKFAIDFARTLFGVDRPGAALPPGLLEWTVNAAMQASADATLRTMDATAKTDFTADLTRLTLPMLILHGEDDQITPVGMTARRLSRMVPGSRIRCYEGGPHGIWETHQEEVNADILRFIDPVGCDP